MKNSVSCGEMKVRYMFAVLQHAGYTEGRATIVSCALGIQAALADLALTTLGIQNVKLYHVCSNGFHLFSFSLSKDIIAERSSLANANL